MTGQRILPIVLSYVASVGWTVTTDTASAQGQIGTIKVVYPFVAGGSGDVLARIVTEQIATGLGAPAIVENRSGAAGRLAAKAVATAPVRCPIRTARRRAPA